MKNIDQHSAIVSQEKALLPLPTLIDGRTEQDRLAFLAEFASLINFYDGENKIHGNWVPFLLKDPVFLLAQISTTRFTELHDSYKNICHKLELILTHKIGEADLSASMNRLFDLVTTLFMRIERWTYYMQNASESYDLKEYVINQVRSKYSAVFWAILSLQDNLIYTKAVPDINPVKYYLFQSYDYLIWKQNQGLNPFWDVLNIPVTLKDSTRNPWISPAETYDALKNAANDLFNFFYTVIQHADTEYENQKIKTSQYPDTILLRTFINLLGIHQEQLNTIAHRHLHFYYKDILKQNKYPAKADRAFVCAELSKPTTTFNLQSGTVFNAGLDAQKNPIVFSAVKNAELNPATITNVCTLTRIPINTDFSTLCQTAIPNSGTVNKDVAGNVIGWETFGGSPTSLSVVPKLGFGFASPLLLLREGCRKVKIHLGYDASKGNPVNLEMLKEASFFLSTQTGWLSLSPNKPIKSNCFTLGEEKEIVLREQQSNPVSIEINLDVTHPPIEAFTVNPDGLNSEWPMFKVEFSTLYQPEKPPVLTSISIDVTATNIKNVQLYNDYGALSTKTPYQLFGPTPLLNSNFIIGSDEIFTKPLTSLSAELNWDKLPDSFNKYYNQYNVYLGKNGSLEVKQEKKEIAKVESSIKQSIIRLLKFIISPFKKLFPKAGPKIETGVSNALEPAFQTLESDEVMPWLGPFNDACFRVNFQALMNSSWAPLDMINKKSYLMPNPDTTGTPDKTSVDKSQALFNSPLTTPGEISQTLFTSSDPGKFITPFPCNPAIQNTTLKYTDTSSDGFIKMELTGPDLGFGSELYPKVVSYYALANAYNIAHSKDSDAQFILLCSTDPKTFVLCPPPNLPFAPKVSGAAFSYSAFHTYKLNEGKKPIADESKGTSEVMGSTEQLYPLQCYLYSVFNNYMVYDNTQKKSEYEKNYMTSLAGTQKITNGVPLFSSFEDSGALFIELQDLVPAEQLNLYFELKRITGDKVEKADIGYYYLGVEGWNKLDVIADTTDKFSCSGILSVAVPAAVSNSTTLMSNDQKFWFVITAKNDPGFFAQTLFLKTNGFVVERTGTSFLKNYQAPVLPANSITKPQNPIPEIATVLQPFDSFGGKGAENTSQMNRRVSNRLKTKDRAVNAEDYYRMIQQHFDDVYYSKSLLNRHTKKVEVFLAQKFKSAAEAGAFVPVISKCTEEKVKKFLKARTSSFCHLEAGNFEFEEVEITAVVTLKSGFEKIGMEKKINDHLNVFLSPWIQSTIQQVVIDQEITASQTAEFIQGIEGVDGVQCVGFNIPDTINSENTDPVSDSEINDKENTKKEQLVLCGTNHVKQSIQPRTATTLMISCMNHNITCILPNE